MPRALKKEQGVRNYENYTSETYQKCLAAVFQCMLIESLSQEFGIHGNTTSSEIHEKHAKYEST